MTLDKILETLMEIGIKVGGKIVIALLILVIGSLISKKLVKLLDNAAAKAGTDDTVRIFGMNALRIILKVVILISIISVFGIPMSTVIAGLTTAAAAIGLALQGSLSNFAGGIMIMIHRPFQVGDYIMAAGEEGTVGSISMFYTRLTTVDNKRVLIPNGSLMNANVINYSSEPTRRVDLEFSCGKGESVRKVQSLLLETICRDERVMKEPEPFARIIRGTNEGMTFTVRAWVKSEDYWDVYFDLTENLTEALAEAGVRTPAVRVIAEELK